MLNGNSQTNGVCDVIMNIDFEIIKNLELELSSLEGRKNSIRLSEILSNDFEEIGKSGRIFNKKNILSLLSNEDHHVIELGQFRFTKLSDASILVKYISRCNGINALRSSIWIKNNTNWQLLHHQGTACE